MKTKSKTKVEQEIYRVIINWSPKRSPEGQLEAIVAILNNFYTPQKPVEGSKTDTPTSDPHDGFEGLRKLAKEERVQKGAK
jgi:hypothetical protein